MALQTTAEQLEAVQTAITAVMSNQSYTIDGRTFTRASLRDLQDREDILLKRYNRETAKNRPRVSKIQFGDFD